MNTSKSLADLIAKYDDWHECDEYHIHDGTGEHEGRTPLPHDFNDEKFKQAIVEAVEGLVDNSHPFPGAVVPNGWYEGWDAAKLQLKLAIKEWQ